MIIRLNKYLADSGVASRRKADELVRQGRVSINGIPVTNLGSRIDIEKDKVFVDGKPVAGSLAKKIYIKLYKPRGVVSSCVSQRGEETVVRLLKGIKERLFPVGRLDKDSEGLLLMTNDGELANQLMHPRYEHEKEYLIDVTRPLTAEQLERWEAGVILDGEKTLPAKVFLESERQFRIILKEGKNRQIRRMVEAVGNRVKNILRLRIGKIKLGRLQPGQYEYLNSLA
ncbi:hypothetical protein A2311_02955 [candidate division WOR-1 bacterium RIFOXYB2_FULL_48_7]|uniref:Pseudouridine synthase n=1 Tax=candidate division WOR-1 bacterium RIFOXYB2_FULL_48_7 TaxID=1802583 RepID=A0A1F4TW17_UNCSA|nr:MAG: hypothetical protein A2311_02955 [candidate division WOR-1 bacterium RIFOXYB2_FULL_48_7]